MRMLASWRMHRTHLRHPFCFGAASVSSADRFPHAAMQQCQRWRTEAAMRLAR
jgi:hypothetical protein